MRNKGMKPAATVEAGMARYLALRPQLVEKVCKFNTECNTGQKNDPVVSCALVMWKEFHTKTDGKNRVPQVMVVLPPLQLQASRNLKSAFNRSPDDGPAPPAATRNTPLPAMDFNLVRSSAEALAAWATKPGTRVAPISKKTPALPVPKVSQIFSSPPKSARPKSPQKSPAISPPIHKGSNCRTPSTTHKKK